jgi:acetyl esterase
MINFLLKLPNWILILLSRKKQITLEHRKLHPPFQLILSQDTLGDVDFSTLTAEQFRESYLEQSKLIPQQPNNKVVTEDHQVSVGSENILVRQYIPLDNAETQNALVYFHGGGWVIGSVETHNELCESLCLKLGFKIFSVDYRLSPEYKYPTPFNDCLAGYNWVVDNSEDLRIKENNISVGGDSAGGNLAAAICLKQQEEGQPLPKAQLLIYPVTDLQFQTKSIQEDCAEGFMLTKAAMEWFAEQYLESKDSVMDPLVSPLLANSLQGLPSAVVVTAGFDPLRDEGNAYAEELKNSGVKVFHKEYLGYIHGFATMSIIPGVDNALEEISKEFLDIT